jgi:hypothetical protein
MDNDGKNGCCEGYEYGAYKYMFPRVMLRSAPYMPHIYFNVISDEQRVKDMCEAIDDLYGIDSNKLTVEQFNEFLVKLEKDQAAQTQEAHEYSDLQDENLYNKLMEVITKLQIGMLIWDVTQGTYAENVEAMRDLFNDVTVHGISVDTLATLPAATVDTVAESGLNVRGLAVFGGYLVGEDFTPEGITYQNEPIPD